MWLCALTLAELVAEWDAQSHHMASHIYSYKFSLSGCRERWGWFCGGGLLLDPSDGGVSSATLLGRR